MVQPVYDMDSESDEELMNHLRSVIITRSKDGATIDEIIEDYLELTGKHLLDNFSCRNDLMIYLSMIDGIWYSTEGTHSVILWFCSTPKTKHLVEMIKRQRASKTAGDQSYRHYMAREVVFANEEIIIIIGGCHRWLKRDVQHDSFATRGHSERYGTDRTQDPRPTATYRAGDGRGAVNLIIVSTGHRSINTSCLGMTFF